MKKWVWIGFLLFLSGCASQPARKDNDQVLSDVAAVVGNNGVAHSEDEDLQLKLQLLATRINSHGQLADRLMIVAGGGRERFNVREMFIRVSDSESGRFLIFGANPALDKAIVGGALSDQQFPRVWVFFVGEPAQEQEMQAIVEAAGSKYSFISKYQE
ncbi:hypothetical protein NJH78_10605 [Pseudomonas chlororaphis]|uniref:hypothetical protein n=1 Tax=Pseudomonas chlororaphis TaxID=587753 RepID=UPI00209ACAD7|nr:hypothetical protein [Pseudomonas chlororaphis]MCO7570425.1 hypothetical protein [Pseudomonas chlororaphis]MCO7587572.1 hypothetical protein [Pseudomonas chlororaphis]MCO7610066.1 hypothetical protein [Pseudomonas chlororaphis]